MSKTSEKVEERPVLLALLICAIAYCKQTPCSLKTADSRRSEGGEKRFSHISLGVFPTDSRAVQFIYTHTCFHTAPSLFSLLCSCTPNRESAQAGGTPSRSTLSRCTSISALALVTGSSARLDLFRLLYLCVGLARRSQPAGRCRTDTGLCCHDGICSGSWRCLIIDVPLSSSLFNYCMIFLCLFSDKTFTC